MQSTKVPDGDDTLLFTRKDARPPPLHALTLSLSLSYWQSLQQLMCLLSRILYIDGMANTRLRTVSPSPASTEECVSCMKRKED